MEDPDLRIYKNPNSALKHVHTHGPIYFSKKELPEHQVKDSQINFISIKLTSINGKAELQYCQNDQCEVYTNPKEIEAKLKQIFEKGYLGFGGSILNLEHPTEANVKRRKDFISNILAQESNP